MRLAYTIVYASNVEESIAFYERAFGVKRRFVHESGAYGELETGNTTLAFAAEQIISHPFAKNRSADTPAGVEVAFVADDVPAAFAHAVEEGAIAVAHPLTKPWAQVVSYVCDNNGFLVEICSAM